MSDLGKVLGYVYAHPAPEELSQRIYDALEILSGKLEVDSDGDKPDPSYGHGYESCWPQLIVRPYDWNFDGEWGDRMPNLEFNGVNIHWYKYLGRGMECEIDMDSNAWETWIVSLEKYAKEFVRMGST